MSFLEKIAQIPIGLFRGSPGRVVGIDIGTYSTKVIELRYEKERAVLETYGELINDTYLKKEGGVSGGLVYQKEEDIADIIKEIVQEAGVKSKKGVYGIPAGASFVTTMPFPQVPEKELEGAIPFEARKYVPIPISEVVLDWDRLDVNEEGKTQDILLIAVSRGVIDKFKKVGEAAGISVSALEVESFSLLRSLGASDPAPSAYINIGHRTTTLAIGNRGKLYVSHSFNRGSYDLTAALQAGLGISQERAESIKREIGLSEKMEEREIASIMLPQVEALFSEIERFIQMHNRKTGRSIQRAVLTGGGSNLKGVVELVASKFGIEATKGNPFSRAVTPPHMQPALREIAPSFSVAMGLALYEFVSS